MLLSESPLLHPEVLVARPEKQSFDVAAWRVGDEVIIRQRDEITLMRQGDAFVTLVPGPQSGALELHAQNDDVLWLLVRGKPNQVAVKFLVPVRSTSLSGNLEFAVDQRVADDLNSRRIIDTAEVKAAVEWLTEEFILDSGPVGVQRVFASIHARSDESRLQLQGRTFVVDLSRKAGSPNWVDRVTNRRPNQLDAISLLQGRIRFVDSDIAANSEAGIEHTLLDTAVTSYGAYLDLWRLYSDKEWKREITRAANINALRYSARRPVSQEGGGWLLEIDAKALAEFKARWKDLANEDDQLEVDEFAPDWHSERYTDLSASDGPRRFRGKPDFTSNGLVLESNERTLPSESGYIYLSLTGNRTQQERRNNARRSIEAGLGVPTLNRLLQDLPVPRLRPSNLPGLTPYAKKIFRSGKATDKQEVAIKVALNTPDVALIIGPPGTGKTQVIAALERRLAELNEGHAISQQVLISSFQHDAVENALERTDVYGLPAIKVGSRRQDVVQAVEIWRQAHVEKLDGTIQHLREAEPSAVLLDQLDRLLYQLLISGVSHDQRAEKFAVLDDLLMRLAKAARIRPSVNWQSKWADYCESSLGSTPKTNDLSNAKRLRLTRAVRSLRVLNTSFQDDGSQRALLVLSLVKDMPQLCEAHETALLQSMAVTKAPEVGELDALSALKDLLLDRLRPDQRPAKIRNTLNPEAAILISELQSEIADKVAASRAGCYGVLERYRDAFVSHPSWVRRAVENYSAIVGATCQQSASHMMMRLKNLSPNASQAIQFQSVIIDEAARANPLDLFIPMAMAKRRIVLVGDHRQLPHLLDPAVEEEIRSERGDQVKSDTYQQSLFERLWRQFKAREDADGVPRVVMLDMQFRMHPILGDFVSKQFYESAGLGKVESGKKAEDFPDTVPIFGKSVCCWLDVPFEAGSDERFGTSRVRVAEASRIASEVQRLLSQLPSDMSVGVITFYSAQRDRIFKELEKYNISERGEEGWRVRTEHAASPDCPERLRVGTVDSFQGKEFDVVFLSAVRSNTQKLGPRDDAESEEAFDKAASRKYGHLRSSNRLNVAMSRQRRLLVAVGDREMFTGAAAMDAVPEMSAFLDLCDEEVRRVS